jgi:O-antigen/teichoic acid export membrane protein
MINLDRFLHFFDDFVKNILVLASSTFFVHALMYFGLPFVVKLYGPVEFGNYSLIFSFVIINSVISSAKYDTAILIPESIEDAISLSKLVLLISVLYSIIIFILFSFTVIIGLSVPAQFSIFFDFKVALFISIYLVLVSSNSVLLNLICRLGEFKALSYGRMIRFPLSLCISLFLGLFYKSYLFLLVGDFIGLIFSSLYYYKICSKKIEFSRKIDVSILKATAKRFKKFPLYTLPSSFLNKLITQSPLFLMNHFFSPTHVGNYALCERLLSAPTALISEATATVFRGELSSSSRAETKRIVFCKVLKTLVVLGIPIFLILFFFGGLLIELFFGDDFFLAERYTKFLVFPLLFQFIFTPLTFVLFYFEKQKLEFGIQIFSFLLLSFSVFVYSNYFSTDTAFLITIVANSIIRIMLEFVFSKQLIFRISSYEH